MIQVKLHKVNIAIENEKNFHIFEQSIFKKSNFAMKNMLLPWMKLSWVYILIIPICHWSLLNGKERLSLNKLKLHIIIIVNDTMHKCYFDQVIIFWMKYRYRC